MLDVVKIIAPAIAILSAIILALSKYTWVKYSIQHNFTSKQQNKNGEYFIFRIINYWCTSQDSIKIQFRDTKKLNLVASSKELKFINNVISIDRILPGEQIDVFFLSNSGKVENSDIITAETAKNKIPHEDKKISHSKFLETLMCLIIFLFVFGVIYHVVEYELSRDKKATVQKTESVQPNANKVEDEALERAKIILWKDSLDKAGWTDYSTFFEHGFYKFYEASEFPFTITKQWQNGKFYTISFSINNKADHDARVTVNALKSYGTDSYEENRYWQTIVLSQGKREGQIKILSPTGSESKIFVIEFSLIGMKEASVATAKFRGTINQ